MVETARHEPVWYDRTGRKSECISTVTGTTTDKGSDDSRERNTKLASYYRERKISSVSDSSDSVPVLGESYEMVQPEHGEVRRMSEESTALPPPAFNSQDGRELDVRCVWAMDSCDTIWPPCSLLLGSGFGVGNERCM